MAYLIEETRGKTALDTSKHFLNSLYVYAQKLPSWVEAIKTSGRSHFSHQASLLTFFPSCDWVLCLQGKKSSVFSLLRNKNVTWLAQGQVPRVNLMGAVWVEGTERRKLNAGNNKSIEENPLSALCLTYLLGRQSLSSGKILDASQGCTICLSGWGTGAYLPLMRIRKKSPTGSLPGHHRISWVFLRSIWFRSPKEPYQDPESELCCQLLPGHLYRQKMNSHQSPEVVPNTILRMVQTLPAQPELLPALSSPEQTWTMSCFPQARWRSDLGALHTSGWRGQEERAAFSLGRTQRNTCLGCSCCYQRALWIPPPATPTVSNSYNYKCYYWQ